LTDIKCVEHVIQFNTWNVQDERMWDLLEIAGFGTVSRLQRLQLDWNLIRAVVERWRPETHTFHFRHGEMTITLQDVAMLSGLRVDGLAVCATLDHDWNQVCMNLLGVEEEEARTAVKGGYVSLQWLQQNYQVVEPDATDEQVMQHTRAYILFQLGSGIMGDKSGNKVHLRYLLLLENIFECGNYSWGAASLAVLYQYLDQACLKKGKQLAGFLTLLQIWRWEHLHVG